LDRQVDLVSNLSRISKHLKGLKLPRLKKIDILKDLMMHDKTYNFQELFGLPLPLDPSIRVERINAGNQSYLHAIMKYEKFW
jgi:hypothetical protein